MTIHSTNATSNTISIWQRITIAAVVIYCAVFIVFTIGRFERYNATGFDLAFYDQILWRTAQGDVMGMTIEGNGWSNWAFHVEPILLIIAPFTRIFSDTRWLLVLQTIALAIAAIPVYRIAVRTWSGTDQKKREWAGTLFAVLYLLYPSVGWANKFDFHPITLTTPLLLWAFDAAEMSLFRRTSILLLLAMFCKEEMGFVVACFGLYWFMRARWRGGLLWFVGGIIFSLVGLFVIIPGAQVTGRADEVLPNQALLRYAWLFRGTWEERIAYITGPHTPIKIRFLIQLFTPLLFTPLLKPGILFIAAPIFGLSLLSANLNQVSIYHHYMANVVPFLMIAAIKGTYDAQTNARKIRSNIGLKLRPQFVSRLLLTGMVAATVLMFVIFNPLTFIPREPYAPIYGWEAGASLEGLNAVKPLIPPESCLTASNNVTTHYAQRWEIYAIGIGNYFSCGLVLVDMADARFVSFGSPQQYACKQFIAEGYGVRFYQDNVVLLERGKDSDPALADQFSQTCRDVDWQAFSPTIPEPSN
jgi:uncharacterized membrane protein